MNKRPSPKSMDQFIAELEERDQTLSAWARERGYSFDVVYAVVRGRNLGRYGKGREVMRAMGVQPPAMFARRGSKAGAAA